MLISLNGLYYPLATTQGNTFKLTLDFSIDGVQQNFSDYTFVAQITDRENETPSESFSVVENPNDVTKIDISLTSTQTRKGAGTYYYEIKAVDNNTADVRTLLQGPFTLQKSDVDLG